MSAAGEAPEIKARQALEARWRRDERLWLRSVEALECYPEELVQETFAECGWSWAGVCFGLALWLTMCVVLWRLRPGDGAGLALGS